MAAMRDGRLVNYYEILGVPPGAAPGDIRTAYRSRIAHYHPDRNPSPHATAIAALLNEAWEVLGDPERRNAYDAKPRGEQLRRDAVARPVQKPDGRPASGSNRRVSARLKTLFTVWVTKPPKAFYATSTCVDLSTTGMALTLSSYVDVDSGVTLTLDLPSGPLEVDARVVRCAPLKRRDRWKVGVAFTRLDDRLERRIAAFIEWERDSRLDEGQ
jgi:curved DNA-binding protein CbpA